MTNQDLFKIDLRALENLRAAPTLEAAGEAWSDAVARSLKATFENPALREPVIVFIKAKIPGSVFDGLADNAYDIVTNSIVQAIDGLDGEDDV